MEIIKALFLNMIFISLVLASDTVPLIPQSSEREEVSFSFQSEGDFDNWSSFYYAHPDPQRVIDAFRYLAAQGALKEEEDQAGLIAFFGEIFRQNEATLSDWIQDLEGLDEKDQQLVWHALWFSNRPQSAALLLDIRYRTSEEGKQLIDRLLKEEPPEVLDIPMVSPGVLDMLWGTFFASGDERCVVRIIDTLEFAKPKGDLNLFLIGESARWSLTTNAMHHAQVLAICEKQLKQRPTEIRTALEKVVQEAKKR